MSFLSTREQKHDRQITIKLTKEEFNKIENLSKQFGMSRSKILRELMWLGIDLTEDS